MLKVRWNTTSLQWAVNDRKQRRTQKEQRDARSLKMVMKVSAQNEVNESKHWGQSPLGKEPKENFELTSITLFTKSWRNTLKSSSEAINACGGGEDIMLLMVSNNTLGLFLWFLMTTLSSKEGSPGVCVCVSMSGSGACWALAAVGQGHGGWGYPSLFFPAWCWCPSPVCWYLLVPEQVAECSGILEWLTQFGWVGAVTRFRLSLTLLVLVDWAGYWLHVQMGPQIWGMSAHVRILFIVASAVWQPLVQRW